LAGYLTSQEARPSIEQTIRMEKKLAAVVSEGITYVEALRGGQSMDQLAVENNLEIRVTDPFSRTAFVPGIGQQNEAIGTAFGLDGGEYSDVIQAGSNAYILQLVQHMAPDSAAWDLQKENQRAQLMASLEQDRLGGWIEGLRALARIVDRREEVLQPADEELPQNPFFGF
jgi:hypothetical protein